MANEVDSSEKRELENVEAHISGATMAWILSRAQSLKNGDETHAIFGHITVQNVKGEITDSQEDHTKDKVYLAIKFITVLPDTVWNRNRKEWDNEKFQVWRSRIQKNLGLDTPIVGFARFRRLGGIILKAPMGAVDLRLCEFLSRANNIITFLMAVSTQDDLKEDKKNLVTTDVTMGCVKAEKGIPTKRGYVDLIVQNLGLPPESITGGGQARVFNRQTLSSLEKASSLSAQLRTQLENVHDSYQRQLLPPSATTKRISPVKMEEDLPATSAEELPDESPMKRTKVEN